MLIESVHIRNFRCIQDARLDCGRFTSLVGANGVGKSTFLRALEMFYGVASRITLDDFFGGNDKLEISIAVTFCDLQAEAARLFAKFLEGDRLTVERIFTLTNGKPSSQFHGAALRNPAFRDVRKSLEIKDRGKTARIAYDALRQEATYSDLPEWTTIADVTSALANWEANNPNRCARERDDGKFFSFSEVGDGYLGRFTRLLYIPAVREASGEAAESRGSALSGLMDLVVRAALTNKEAYQRLQRRTQVLFERLMRPESLPELAALSGDLSTTLQLYVPDAHVALEWRPVANVELPVPAADIRVREGDYETAVERTGHGLQRAFIMTMLQRLARAQAGTMAANAAADAPLPTLVLAIEEPELYQHPSRQRHLASTLVNLATNGLPGVAQNTQIVCSTHSPLFLSMERIDDVRLLRRVKEKDEPLPRTSVVRTSLDRVADVLWSADAEPDPRYTATTLLPRMKAVMTPWLNEGFFADVVILVEGEDDRAALLGTAQLLGLDIDGRGFAILPCGGKTCLDRPFAVFRDLGIPTYIVWDADKGDKSASPHDNRRLLRLVGLPELDWPSHVDKTSASFEVNLETTMRTEIGNSIFEQCLRECQVQFAIPKRKHALKNPAVVSHVIDKAKQQGYTSATLEGIVRTAALLRG